jgi:hypothetical protein
MPEQSRPSGSKEDCRAWRAGWDSARRVRSAVDVRGEIVEVRLVKIGLNELPRCTLESQPLIEGTSVPPHRALPGQFS